MGFLVAMGGVSWLAAAGVFFVAAKKTGSALHETEAILQFVAGAVFLTGAVLVHALRKMGERVDRAVVQAASTGVMVAAAQKAPAQQPAAPAGRVGLPFD